MVFFPPKDWISFESLLAMCFMHFSHVHCASLASQIPTDFHYNREEILIVWIWYRVLYECVAVHTLFNCHFLCVTELKRDIEFNENDRSGNFSSCAVFFSVHLYALNLTVLRLSLYQRSDRWTFFFLMMLFEGFFFLNFWFLSRIKEKWKKNSYLMANVKRGFAVAITYQYWNEKCKKRVKDWTPMLTGTGYPLYTAEWCVKCEFYKNWLVS